jgi:hypothetical protein
MLKILIILRTTGKLQNNQQIHMSHTKHTHSNVITSGLETVKILTAHKFQNIYMHIYLFFKSRILLPDEGPRGQKYIAVIDNIIKRLLCLTVKYVSILRDHELFFSSIVSV